MNQSAGLVFGRVSSRQSSAPHPCGDDERRLAVQGAGGSLCDLDRSLDRSRFLVRDRVVDTQIIMLRQEDETALPLCDNAR